MKMIVGLGNPGSKYEYTRHNAGFRVLDRLAGMLDIRIYINRNGGLTGQGFYKGEKLLLVKPLTFMNLSGECVGPLSSYYRLNPEDILIVCDDVNLPLGQLRVREKGSAGGHNGLKDVIRVLGSDAFPRLRVGMGLKPAELDLVDYVLMQLTAEEKALSSEAEERAAEAARMWLTDGTAAAMNAFNQRIRADGQKL